MISFTDRQRSELRSTSLAGSGGRRGRWVGHSANVTERLRAFLDEILPQNVPHPCPGCVLACILWVDECTKPTRSFYVVQDIQNGFLHGYPCAV